MMDRLPAPPMSEKAKGKQREVADDNTMPDTVDSDSSSDSEEPESRASKSTTSILHPRHSSMFADDDYQRLLVENAQLRRQADLLAKRMSHPELHIDETSQNTSDNLKTSQVEIRHLRTRLEHSESARDRLQTELAALRSFLLSTIAVQPTLLPARPISQPLRSIEVASPAVEEVGQREVREKTPVLLDDGTLQEQASSASRPPASGDNPTGPALRAASADMGSRSQSPEVPLATISNAKGKAAEVASSGPAEKISLPQMPKPRRSRSRRRRVTMGDAETELLLCAARRIQRVYKHIPGVYAAPVPAMPRSVLPPLPIPLHSTSASPALDQNMFNPPSTFPRRPSAAPPAIPSIPARTRSSKRRKSRSYKEVDEDEEDDEYSEDAFSPATEAKDDKANEASDSQEPPLKKKKKIGRPLGSPNKTKTISFNKIGNLMRPPAYGLFFANQQLQQVQQQSGGEGGMQAMQNGHENAISAEGSIEDLVAAAETMRDDASPSGEPRTLRSRTVIQDTPTEDGAGAGEMEIDDEWPTTIQDEIDGSGDDGYEDGDGEYQEDELSTSRLSGRNNSRNSRRSVSQSARPSSASSKSKSASVKRSEAPQTPNGLERQISALDVLADQAASASTGPGGQNKGQRGAGTTAARSMQQALFNGDGEGQRQVQQNARSDANGGVASTTSSLHQSQNGSGNSLADAFTYQPAAASTSNTFYQPNFGANENISTSSSTSTYPSTSTSQYQPFVFPPLPQSTLQSHHSPQLGGDNNHNGTPQYETTAYEASSTTPSTVYASPYVPNSHLPQFAPVPDYSSYDSFTDPLPPSTTQTPSQPTSQMTIAQQLSLPISAYHPLIDPEDLNKGMTPAAALAKKSRSPYIKWTPKEDEMLVRGILKHGTKWDFVAKELPDRSYHQCRQRWLRGLKCGESLPKSIEHLRPQLDQAVANFESNRASSKVKEPVDE